ncbi:RNA methyltransferase [Ahrensia sp. R2A130]|uniref:TrmH family RNA methyltransferase n=1 Tax=Ahrensia sp. R2A130 TaxID=744979 RepID=UPI0001E0D826|nr:RNA methyltransferase [Ahrensia sp. R2A130]EFL89783.1 rRNA methylase [Ahrensia sp. R2A130]
MSETTKPGRIEEITSTANPRVKSIRALAMKKNRDREGLFIAEGEKLARDALDGGWHIDTLLYAKSATDDERRREGLETLAVKVRARGGDVLLTNAKVLTAITKRDNSQAVVSVLKSQTTDAAKITPQGDTCWLVLDRVRDPGNLGTIIRTADALGVAGVVLVGETTDPFGLEAVRATMGSLFAKPLVRLSRADYLVLAESWKAGGGHIVGTHLAGAVDHRTIDYAAKPLLLLMGNEQQGLDDEMAASCDHLALIAMGGAADSLNLAVATGIVTFAARSHALKAPA